MYCVIVGDIIKSRKMNQASFVAKIALMDNIFQKINEKYSKYIMSDFGAVRGDAFEGVIYSQAESVSIIEDLIKLFYEKIDAGVRISCVTGELPNNSLERDKSDGPAFYTAFEQIDILKEKSKKEKVQHWFQVKLITNTIAQPLIDSILELVASITKRWTDQQRKIIWSMSDYSFQQSIVSKKLSIAPSIISKQLKAANYQVYREAMDQLKKYLQDVEVEKANDINADFPVLYSLGLRYNEKREYLQAEKFITMALKKATEEYGENDMRLVPIYNGLVQSLVEQASFGEISETDKKRLFENAEKSIDTSLFIQSQYPIDIKKYIQTLTAKGNLYLETNKAQEAYTLFEQAENLVEDFFGSNQKLLYSCNINKALARMASEDYTEAYKLLKLKRKEGITREHPLKTADYLYNVGSVLKHLKRNKFAKLCLSIAYNIYSREYPLKHPLVLDVKKDLDSISTLRAEKGGVE